MKHIVIVSDISTGYEIHGNSGSTFCFKVVDGNHVQTFCGAFKEYHERTGELEALAAYYGINTALSMHGQCKVTAYIDHNIIQSKKAAENSVIAKIRKFLKTHNAEIKDLPYDHTIKALHQDCHNMAGVRQKIRYGNGQYGKTARQFVKAHKHRIPAETSLWKQKTLTEPMSGQGVSTAVEGMDCKNISQ